VVHQYHDQYCNQSATLLMSASNAYLVSYKAASKLRIVHRCHTGYTENPMTHEHVSNVPPVQQRGERCLQCIDARALDIRGRAAEPTRFRSDERNKRYSMSSRAAGACASPRSISLIHWCFTWMPNRSRNDCANSTGFAMKQQHKEEASRMQHNNNKNKNKNKNNWKKRERVPGKAVI
jgi:hypothetical protein